MFAGFIAYTMIYRLKRLVLELTRLLKTMSNVYFRSFQLFLKYHQMKFKLGEIYPLNPG